MTTAPIATRTRPQWAAVLALGFFFAGFGALLYGAGTALAIEGMPAVGTIVFFLGAAISLFGGAVYFLDRFISS